MKIAHRRSSVAQTGIIPNGYRLITDTMPLVVKDVKSVVSEGIGGKEAVMKITGIFQKADDKNQNGRVYPRSVLESAVKSLQEDLPSRSIMGEFDHPADAKIHLDRVSHLITNIWMEGKYVYGEAEVLEKMPYGQQLSALLKSGVQVGISSRGVGDMEIVNEGLQDESYVVQEGYEFVTWDVVGEPSVQEATMSVMENKNRLMTRGRARKINPEAALKHEISEWLKK